MKQNKELTPRKWGMLAVIVPLVLLVMMAVLTIVVDPYFHYHAPLDGIRYRLYEQRYINDGISRHFDYDAVIIGSSLSENMKPSLADELFDCKSIKLPYSGAGLKELWMSIDRLLTYNPEVKQVFVLTDTEEMMRDKDYMRYSEYPEYLYDDNFWNDASYWWNKDTFYRGTFYNLLMTVTGQESTTFDEYSAKSGKTGEEAVLPYVGEIPDAEDAPNWSYQPDDKQRVIDNIEQNILSVVRKYPDTEFCLICPAPSIARWAKYYIWGDMNARIQGSMAGMKLLLEPENVSLYSFQDDFELVCDLDRYHDTVHYTSEVAEYMLREVAAGNRQLTKDNYKEYFDRIDEFYRGYDYQSLRME